MCCFKRIGCDGEIHEPKTYSLKSNKRTSIGENSDMLRDQQDMLHSVKKRSLPSIDEIRLYVDKHNTLRRLEGSSNMHILVNIIVV